jgi:hypothetical protein
VLISGAGFHVTFALVLSVDMLLYGEGLQCVSETPSVHSAYAESILARVVHRQACLRKCL